MNNTKPIWRHDVRYWNVLDIFQTGVIPGKISYYILDEVRQSVCLMDVDEP